MMDMDNGRSNFGDYDYDDEGWETSLKFYPKC